MGKDRHIGPSARTAKRKGALYSAGWPALRQWRHPYGPCDEQGAEGHHRPQPVAIGQGCALCPRLGLSRSSHRMEDRRGISQEKAEQGRSPPAGIPRPMPRLCRQMGGRARSEEHTSELQSLMRISYAVFCLKKKKIKKSNH